MLAEVLREEGFQIKAIDDFDISPSVVISHTPWQAVGVERPDGTGAAVEIVKNEAILRVWVVTDDESAANIIARIPLADPECFEKVGAALRGDKT